jgi:hypothetical protein
MTWRPLMSNFLATNGPDEVRHLSKRAGTIITSRRRLTVRKPLNIQNILYKHMTYPEGKQQLWPSQKKPCFLIAVQYSPLRARHHGFPYYVQ